MNGSAAGRKANGLWVEEGGSGDLTLLLMHGMGGTGAVWNGLRPHIEKEWPGRWIIPDFRGHGRSDHAPVYGTALHAADMASLLTSDVAEGRRIVLAGHSMGGQVGMVLATGWFGVMPEAVVTVGTKVDWDDEQLAKILKLVDTPVRWFETRAEALERFVLVNGLKGLVEPSSQMAATGIVEQGGRFRLAADNRAAMVGRSSTREIYGVTHAPIVLAAGENDNMVSHAEQHSLDASALVLPGLGHNAHIEDPGAFWALVRKAARL